MKFEINDNLLYSKNDTEGRQDGLSPILLSLFYDMFFDIDNHFTVSITRG